MQITYAVVISLDGKITRGDESHIYTWTSKEDQDYFRQLVSDSSLVIMGSNTFTASREMILQRLNPKTLRVVMTHHPEIYAGIMVPGQLEFTSDVPHKMVEALERRGYSEGLFVGGSQLSESFFAKHLITHLSLTIEPRMFGVGKPFFPTQGVHDIRLKLLQSQQLNEQGTLLLKYEVYNT